MGGRTALRNSRVSALQSRYLPVSLLVSICVIEWVCATRLTILPKQQLCDHTRTYLAASLARRRGLPVRVVVIVFTVGGVVVVYVVVVVQRAGGGGACLSSARRAAWKRWKCSVCPTTHRVGRGGQRRGGSSQQRHRLFPEWIFTLDGARGRHQTSTRGYGSGPTGDPLAHST